MSRTAKAASLVIIIGLAVLIPWLWSSMPPLEIALPSSPAISTEGARIIKYDAGKKLWELEARSIRVTESDSVAEQVLLHFFDDQGRETLTVQAPQARLHNSTGNMELLGSLVATGSEFSLVTENLYWDNEKKLLSTPASVRIERDDFTLVGQGLEYSSETGLVTILSEAQLTLRVRKE